MAAITDDEQRRHVLLDVPEIVLTVICMTLTGHLHSVEKQAEHNKAVLSIFQLHSVKCDA